MTISQDKLQFELESLLDTGGVSASELLNALANVCSEKSVHIEVSYNDKATARPWKAAAKKIATLASSIDV